MGLFDSIRRVVGGGQSAADDGSDDSRSDLVDTRELDPAALRERADGVSDEVEQLDFSLPSLSQFDAAIDGGYDEDPATPAEAGLYATDTVRFGCYLGEVLVRQYGGEWARDPDWGVTVTGPDGSTTVAVFDVAERSITGESVFADVADRAAVAVGLDGTEPSAEGDDDSGTPGSEDANEDSGTPASEDANEDSGTPGSEDANEDSGTPASEDANEDSGEPTPAVSDDDADTADPGALIEEAEPTASTTETAGAGHAADGDPEPSLFDDRSAGPTVADAPSADDGPPVTGGDLRERYAEAAAEFVAFWEEYDLDYTPASLARLDALVGAEWDDERFEDAEFGSEATFDDRVFTSVSTELGSYFGEVLVRDLGGEWSEATATDAVVVERGDGQLAIPVFKVAGTSIKQRPVFERSYESLLSDLDAA